MRGNQLEGLTQKLCCNGVLLRSDRCACCAVPACRGELGLRGSQLEGLTRELEFTRRYGDACCTAGCGPANSDSNMHQGVVQRHGESGGPTSCNVCLLLV
jgi:hypothetical protein